MPKRTELIDTEKNKIVDQKNDFHREIAAKIKRSKTVVTNFLADPIKNGTAKRSGRKPKVTPRVKRLILNKSSNTRISANQLIGDLTLDLSKTTINRVRH